jgi:hypothetical protein
VGGVGVDMVDTDRVGSNCLHGLGIELALVRINERISWSALIRNAWYSQLASPSGGQNVYL